MKLRAAGRRTIIRRLAIAAVPIGAVAALLGPAAGAANALPIGPDGCIALRGVVYDAWDESEHWEFEAGAALEQGDVTTWAEDNVIANGYKAQGDALYDQYKAAGC